MIATWLAGVLALAPVAGDELQVWVTDGRTENRVAGAEVHARFVTSKEKTLSAMAWGSGETGLADFEARVLAEGERAVTDEEGRVVFRPRPEWTEVELVARGHGAFGTGFARCGEEESIELYADFELRARTVGANGAPVAGVPVCMRRRVGEFDDWLASVESGADGIALIPHAGFLHSRAVVRDPATTVSIALDLCLDRAVAVDVVGPQAEPVVLELPPTGTVEVVFDGFDGSPAASGGRVRIEKAECFSDWLAFIELPAGCVSAEVVAGRARFPHVGLGLELELSGRLNPSSAPRWAGCEGPKVAGESVEVSLALGPRFANVWGWLVDPQGEVLGEELVRFTLPFALEDYELMNQVVADPGSGRRGFLRTDAAGRFALDFERVDPPGETQRTLEMSARRADRTVLGSEIWLDELEAGETRALGDVVMHRDELVARGRVLVPNGAPVVGAEIELAPERDPLLEEADEWLYPGRVVTDEAGRFELRALPWRSSSSLSVASDGFLPKQLDVAGPEHGEMQIVLSRPGWIEGRAELPLGTDPAQLEVQLVRSVEVPEPWMERDDTLDTSRLDPEARFKGGLVEPGPAELRVLYEGLELAARPIVIAEGEPTHVVLELAVFAPLTALELRDEHGRRVERGAYLVRAAGTGSTDDLWRAPRLQHFDAGLLALGWREPPFDVLVAAPGYRLARFEVGAETRELVLQPAFELALELETRPRAFDASERLTLVLRAPRALAPKRADMIALSIPSTAFDAEGRAVLAVPGDGLYCMRLELDVHVRGRGFERTTWELGERELSEALAREPFRIATPRELSR